MQYIKRDNKSRSYGNADLIGKFAYVSQQFIDCSCHHIFKITDIIDESKPTYLTDKHYMFAIYKNPQHKCFCYDGNKELELSFKDQLYILDEDEYIGSFRNFVNNEAKRACELPDKLIADK